ETPSDRPMLERLAAHHADLSQIEQTFTIGEADVEIARRLRLHESSPIAELRRIARDSHGTIIYFGYLFFPGQLVRLDFKVDLKAGNSGGPSACHRHRGRGPWPAGAALSHPEMLGTTGRPRVAPALLATIDRQHLPGDEFARGRRQIDRRFRHIPDVTWPPHRIGLRVGLETLGRIVGKPRGFQHTRGDAVDANAERRPFHGNAL